MLDREFLELASSPGAAGVFRTDSSRRVLAILGNVASEGAREQRHYLTFIIRSSALTNLALGVREGGTIEWDKWKGEVAIIERPPSITVNLRVEGSRVFILGMRGAQKGETCFKIYDFSPGARKEQQSVGYTSRQATLTGMPSAWMPLKSWKVSGDAVVMLDVRRSNSLRACLVFRLTVGNTGPPGSSSAHHRHCLVYLNLHRARGVDGYKRIPQMCYSVPT
jgi:hypothetical protein